MAALSTAIDLQRLFKETNNFKNWVFAKQVKLHKNSVKVFATKTLINKLFELYFFRINVLRNLTEKHKKTLNDNKAQTQQ